LSRSHCSTTFGLLSWCSQLRLLSPCPAKGKSSRWSPSWFSLVCCQGFRVGIDGITHSMWICHSCRSCCDQCETENSWHMCTASIMLSWAAWVCWL
jgi:hypothetical protein